MNERVYAELFALEEEHWWFRGRRSVVRALAGDLMSPGAPRVLDAGCGTGRNLQEYGRFAEAEGVDPSPVAIAFCRRRGLNGVREAPVEKLPFPDGRFGLVFATDVLEHIDDDLAALRELARVSSPGAHLVATVPAYSWLWSSHDDRHHHRRRYTKSMLTARAQAAGWQVVRATYFNTTLLAPIAAVRVGERVRGAGASDYDRTPPGLNGALERVMGAEAAAIARGVSLPAGVSVGLVCRLTDHA